MANSDTPRGLEPVRRNGAPYCGDVSEYYVPASDSTAIYIGGLVKPAGSADADGVMSVTGNVSTGDAVVGVVVGVRPVTRDSTTYREASTERYVTVADNPDTLFAVQDDSDGGALTAAAVGNTADLIGFTSGSTVTGMSSIEINADTATASGDGTEDVVIKGLNRVPDNEIGTNAQWIVRLNNHFWVDGVAGA